MQRFLRLRDFDWVLIAMVFLLSALSVLEIYSATINTKFHGFESKFPGATVVSERRRDKILGNASHDDGHAEQQS